MLAHLATLIESFPGAPNQTRCFNHVLSLTARRILRQFDVPTGEGDGVGTSEEVAEALSALASELELDHGDDDDVDSDDEDDVFVTSEEDKDAEERRDAMSEEELAELNASLGPVRLTLTKVKFELSSPKLYSLTFFGSCSFVLWPMQSRTHPPLSYPNGTKLLKT